MASDKAHDPVDALLAFKKRADAASKMLPFDLKHFIYHAHLPPRRSCPEYATNAAHDRLAQT